MFFEQKRHCHMATVSVKDGIAYGFGLMAYLIGVGLVGGGIAFVGFAIAGGAEEPIGILFAAIGVLVVYAGSLGLLYKVIADGVSTGVDDASTAP